MSRFKLTEDYLLQIKRLLKADFAITEIAAEIGFSAQAVTNFIKRHNLKGDKK